MTETFQEHNIYIGKGHVWMRSKGSDAHESSLLKNTSDQLCAEE